MNRDRNQVAIERRWPSQPRRSWFRTENGDRRDGGGRGQTVAQVGGDGSSISRTCKIAGGGRTQLRRPSGSSGGQSVESCRGELTKSGQSEGLRELQQMPRQSDGSGGGGKEQHRTVSCQIPDLGALQIAGGRTQLQRPSGSSRERSWRTWRRPIGRVASRRVDQVGSSEGLRESQQMPRQRVTAGGRSRGPGWIERSFEAQDSESCGGNVAGPPTPESCGGDVAGPPTPESCGGGDAAGPEQPTRGSGQTAEHAANRRLSSRARNSRCRQQQFETWLDILQEVTRGKVKGPG